MSKPSDFNDIKLLSTFGLSEYETAMSEILKWLADNGDDWKEFRMNVIDEPVIFAMICAAGWIENNYFPKGTFFISQEAIKRLDLKLASGKD